LERPKVYNFKVRDYNVTLSEVEEDAEERRKLA